jgi:hypothetical protein
MLEYPPPNVKFESVKNPNMVLLLVHSYFASVGTKENRKLSAFPNLVPFDHFSEIYAPNIYQQVVNDMAPFSS